MKPGGPRRTCRSGGRTSSWRSRPRTSRETAKASSSSTGAGPTSRTARASGTTRRSSSPCPSRRPPATACSWRRAKTAPRSPRIVAQARAGVVRPGQGLERPRALSARAGEASDVGGERVPPARRVSVPLVPPGRGDLRRVPRALLRRSDATRSSASCAACARRDRRRDAPARGPHPRGRPDDARASTPRRSTSTATGAGST